MCEEEEEGVASALLATGVSSGRAMANAPGFGFEWELELTLEQAGIVSLPSCTRKRVVLLPTDSEFSSRTTRNIPQRHHCHQFVFDV